LTDSFLIKPPGLVFKGTSDIFDFTSRILSRSDDGSAVKVRPNEFWRVLDEIPS
jgi:hypothetical protein